MSTPNACVEPVLRLHLQGLRAPTTELTWSGGKKLPVKLYLGGTRAGSVVKKPKVMQMRKQTLSVQDQPRKNSSENVLFPVPLFPVFLLFPLTFGLDGSLVYGSLLNLISVSVFSVHTSASDFPHTVMQLSLDS